MSLELIAISPRHKDATEELKEKIVDNIDGKTAAVYGNIAGHITDEELRQVQNATKQNEKHGNLIFINHLLRHSQASFYWFKDVLLEKQKLEWLKQELERAITRRLNDDTMINRSNQPNGHPPRREEERQKSIQTGTNAAIRRKPSSILRQISRRNESTASTPKHSDELTHIPKKSEKCKHKTARDARNYRIWLLNETLESTPALAASSIDSTSTVSGDSFMGGRQDDDDLLDDFDHFDEPIIQPNTSKNTRVDIPADNSPFITWKKSQPHPHKLMDLPLIRVGKRVLIQSMTDDRIVRLKFHGAKKQLQIIDLQSVLVTHSRFVAAWNVHGIDYDADLDLIYILTESNVQIYDRDLIEKNPIKLKRNHNFSCITKCKGGSITLLFFVAQNKYDIVLHHHDYWSTVLKDDRPKQIIEAKVEEDGHYTLLILVKDQNGADCIERYRSTEVDFSVWESTADLTKEAVQQTDPSDQGTLEKFKALFRRAKNTSPKPSRTLEETKERSYSTSKMPQKKTGRLSLNSVTSYATDPQLRPINSSSSYNTSMRSSGSLRYSQSSGQFLMELPAPVFDKAQVEIVMINEEHPAKYYVCRPVMTLNGRMIVYFGTRRRDNHMNVVNAYNIDHNTLYSDLVELKAEKGLHDVCSIAAYDDRIYFSLYE